jgi:isoleucyl-tRNA synthetase
MSIEPGDSSYNDIIFEELNLKKAVTMDAKGDWKVSLDLTITPELKAEGLAREVIRHVQSARKSAGLNVDDRIKLVLITDDSDLKHAIEEYGETIKAETLATDLVDSGTLSYETAVKVEGVELTVSLEKS